MMLSSRGDQGFDRAIGVGGETESRQRALELFVQFREMGDRPPQHRKQRRTAGNTQPRCEVRGGLPIGAAECLHDRFALEVFLEILLEIPDILFRHGVDGLARRMAPCIIDQCLDLLRPRDFLFRQIAVGQVGVADDLDDVGFRQQAQRHRIALGCGHAADREPGHQPGGFLPALRVDLAHEIQAVADAVELGNQRPRAFPGQAPKSDRTCPAWLGPKTPAHIGRCTAASSLRAADGEFPELADQRGLFLAHLVRIVSRTSRPPWPPRWRCPGRWPPPGHWSHD